MSARPSRAKMCTWLSAAIGSIRLEPGNPADIRRAGLLRTDAKSRLRELAGIASELGWHADASLDFAWELIQEYDTRLGASND